MFCWGVSYNSNASHHVNLLFGWQEGLDLALWHNIGPTSFFKTILNPSQLGTQKKGGVHTERPPFGSAEMAGICRFHHRKGKRLVFSRKQAFCVPFGGDKRDRTADLLNAIQALSQLSYTPIFFQKWKFIGYAV